MADCDPSSGPSALVIDDSGLVALDTRELLVELGFVCVQVASRGDEAIRLAGAHPYDWALVDGTLKGGDLDQVVAALDDAGIPLVFVCSLPDGADIQTDRAGRRFIARPYGKRELAALLAAKD